MGTKNGKIKWGILGYARIARVNVIPAMLQQKAFSFYFKNHRFFSPHFPIIYL
jgi:hypothetical protein